MAEDLHLPSDLLDDGFFAGCDKGRRAESERGGDEQGDHLAFLARRMADSFLGDDDVTELVDRRDLQHRWCRRELGLVSQPRRPTPREISSPCLTHHQMQAILHLKQQQKLSAARKVLSEGSRGDDYGDYSSRPWWPHHQIKHPSHLGSGMRAFFLHGAGVRTEAIGTGVFLPRMAGRTAESQTTSVLIPARVVQALNLNLEELGAQARFPGGYVLENDAFAGRRNMVKSHSHSQSELAATRNSICSLPREWTYGPTPPATLLLRVVEQE